MRETTTVRLSSKGQLVLPAWVRKKLDLGPGHEFTVEVPDRSGGVIVLRSLPHKEVLNLLEKGYRWLEETGDDPVARLHEARRKERKREATHRPA